MQSDYTERMIAKGQHWRDDVKTVREDCRPVARLAALLGVPVPVKVEARINARYVLGLIDRP